MRDKIIVVIILLMGILLIGCKTLDWMITDTEIVEMIEYRMEKVRGVNEKYGGIKIRGKAKYHGEQSLDKAVSYLEFGLYDVKGKKLLNFYVPSYHCGEYNLSDIIFSGEIFPFEHEEQKIDIKLWEAITKARFEGAMGL